MEAAEEVKRVVVVEEVKRVGVVVAEEVEKVTAVVVVEEEVEKVTAGVVQHFQ